MVLSTERVEHVLRVADERAPRSLHWLRCSLAPAVLAGLDGLQVLMRRAEH